MTNNWILGNQPFWRRLLTWVNVKLIFIISLFAAGKRPHKAIDSLGTVENLFSSLLLSKHHLKQQLRILVAMIATSRNLLLLWLFVTSASGLPWFGPHQTLSATSTANWSPVPTKAPHELLKRDLYPVSLCGW